MTVTEIAQIAGVSIGTVDRVIHNRGRVADKTRERVQAVIDKIGYQPDLLASQLKKRNKYELGIFIPKTKSTSGYWQMLYNGILDATQKDFAAFSFEAKPFFFQRNKPETLQIQFKKMIASTCCAYIIAPVVPEKTKMLLESFAVQKPYCFVDSSLPDCNPVCTVYQLPYKAGYCAAKITKTISAKEGVYVIIVPFSKTFNQKERSRGFCDWFSENAPNSSIVRVESINFSKKEIYHELDKLFGTTKNLVGICIVSAEVQTVAEYLDERKCKKNIAIVGFDLTSVNRKYLEKGIIDSLIDQRPYEQGQLAVRQLFRKLVSTETPETETYIPLDIYFKENLQ